MNRWEILIEVTITFATGLIFGIGLLLSGMVRRVNILGFLSLGADWNPSLLFVLGCGIIVNLIIFSYMIHYKYPLFYVGRCLTLVTLSSIPAAEMSTGNWPWELPASD